MKYQKLFILLVFLGFATQAGAQQWSGILDPTRAIDWTQVGIPGGIPNRTTICKSETSSVSLATLNSDLAACPNNQVVYLAAGTYAITGTITIPSGVVLRGAGPQSTILNATGTSGAVISMGDGNSPWAAYSKNVTAGATAGSTSITVTSIGSGWESIAVGGFVMITELNDPTYVTISVPNGSCTWCDGSHWSGTRVRGQILEVTAINGNKLTFDPPLYSNYGSASGTSPAFVTPLGGAYDTGAKIPEYSGVENLQIYANKTGYTANISIDECAYCWVKKVEGNYADADHLHVDWGFRDEIRDSYFSNAFTHSPGTADTELALRNKTTGTLVENNIFERLHGSIILEWGAAGNVIGYNYSTGDYDVTSTKAVMEDFVSNHGAHPQFNLWEGNVSSHFISDAFWGSSSYQTYFRNQSTGTTLIAPYVGGGFTGRGVINWAGAYLAGQYTRGFTVAAYSIGFNLIGNVSGSYNATQLGPDCKGYDCGTSPWMYNRGSSPYTSTLVPPAHRHNGCGIDICEFEAFDYGYDVTSDSNGAAVASFAGGPSQTMGYWVGLAYSTSLNHGNFDIASNSTVWSGSLTKALPASFYKSSKPSWFGSVPWPPIGPDVTGGNVDASALAGHVYAIPAEACYNSTARDSYGLKLFDPTVCYPGSTSSDLPSPPTGLTAAVN